MAVGNQGNARSSARRRTSTEFQPRMPRRPRTPSQPREPITAEYLYDDEGLLAGSVEDAAEAPALPDELWLLVFAHRPRWERFFPISAVSQSWRRLARSDRTLWQRVLVLPRRRRLGGPHCRRQSAPRLW